MAKVAFQTIPPSDNPSTLFVLLNESVENIVVCYLKKDYYDVYEQIQNLPEEDWDAFLDIKEEEVEEINEVRYKN